MARIARLAICIGAPAPFSTVYSSIDMNLQLATAANIDTPCAGFQCQLDKGFEQQVKRLGNRLSLAAYGIDPELKTRIPEFNFAVADKISAGSVSDAQGTIVIYRGVRGPRLDEIALAFIIAREMGHVMARHHDERSAATILASLIAQIVLPVVNLARGTALLASSAASALGTQVMTAGSDPHRQQEALDIAIDLLSHQGWSTTEVADSIARYAQDLGNDEWSLRVKNSLLFAKSDIQGALLALQQEDITPGN